MSGLAALLYNELRLLHRQQVTVIAGVSTAIYVIGLFFVPQHLVKVWLPPVIFTEVITMGVLFIAGIVFLERKQNTLSAFVVTPMSTNAWLFTKTIVFTLVSSIAAFALVSIYSETFHIPSMLTTILLSAMLYNQLGLIIALMFQDIRDYFLPLSVTMGISGISVHAYFGLYDTPLYWLVPSHPAMQGITCSINGGESCSYWLNTAVLIGWNVVFFYLSKYTFSRNILDRIGK